MTRAPLPRRPTHALCFNHRVPLMNPERWRQIDTIFKSAVELPSDERAAFVERAGRYDGERGVACAPDGRVVYHSLAGAAATSGS